MWRRTARAAFVAVFLVASLANAIPDGDHPPINHDMNMEGMDMGGGHGGHGGEDAQPTPYVNPAESWPTSYFSYGEHSGPIIAHIALMVLAWCFVLPTGVMLSIARSRLALPSQFIFLVLNAIAVLVGIIYNNQTPDLYENNAHHRLGWVATWVATAQVFMTLIFTYAGRGDSEDASSHERGAFIPVSTDEGVQPYPSRALHDYRWSGDSGQGTERESSSLNSRSMSPNCDPPSDDYDGFEKPEDQVRDKPSWGRRWLQGTAVDRFLSSRVPAMVSNRVLRGLNASHMFIERIIMPFGFAAIATGGVTYSGIMRGIEVFNGLAHFIKGGIFFWYGLLTLGRWIGCWADLGWAWNVKPSTPIVSKWKARAPNGELTESSVIFFYGITNVFLEHLAGSGKGWSATDMEHVSISFMFLGGGLCGMLFESKRIKKALNETIFQSPIHRTADANWKIPDTQGVSLNPMPALVILLLGMMMGSHHQDSMVSTMVHKQWGNLLMGFSLARGATYILLYLKPPTSYYPSRPPTEIIASFCLVAGGLIFMLSTRNVVQAMEFYELDAMFAFTVGMGLSAFVMAYAVLCIALKAWAIKRESKSRLPPYQFPATA